MPYVHLKLVKEQITPAQKDAIIEGITDLIVNLMGRKREYTVITMDELGGTQWAIGGKLLTEYDPARPKVAFVNIKVSKGTTHPEEMAAMIKAVKELLVGILGNVETANYVIVDELNPDAWGFDGIPMTIRNQVSK